MRGITYRVRFIKNSKDARACTLSLHTYTPMSRIYRDSHNEEWNKFLLLIRMPIMIFLRLPSIHKSRRKNQ